MFTLHFPGLVTCLLKSKAALNALQPQFEQLQSIPFFGSFGFCSAYHPAISMSFLHYKYTEKIFNSKFI